MLFPTSRLGTTRATYLLGRGAAALFCIGLQLCVAACSDEDLRISAGGGGDEAPDTRPGGAVAMEVYATETQTCPAGNVHIDVGVVSASPPVFVRNGDGGAKVDCAVTKLSGGKFNASATIEQGSFSFAFSDVKTDGSSALGHVEFTDPKAGTRYASDAAMPCVFQFAPGTAQGVNAGEIFVQFDCPNLVSSADPKSACSSRYGYVRVLNCTK